MTQLEQLLVRIEALLADIQQERQVKEFYSTSDVARALGKSEYTIREYCRKGQVKARRTLNGRGWLIPHGELEKLRNFGAEPEPTRRRS